ncbi:MAG: histidine triad nucleotide-binding protein [Mariprofundaceae bacterium]|nr:histidine triad nucleotide-binding protein [Mariprofundaceae bacterium]
MSDCLFCNILTGDIPSSSVYEDDDVYAFKDIEPKAPIHVLVIPKQHIATLDHAKDAKQLGVLMQKVSYIANEVLHLESGYRVITNVGQGGGQVVFHLHMHILAGKPLPF